MGVDMVLERSLSFSLLPSNMGVETVMSKNPNSREAHSWTVLRCCADLLPLAFQAEELISLELAGSSSTTGCFLALPPMSLSLPTEACCCFVSSEGNPFLCSEF